MGGPRPSRSWPSTNSRRQGEPALSAGPPKRLRHMFCASQCAQRPAVKGLGRMGEQGQTRDARHVGEARESRMGAQGERREAEHSKKTWGVATMGGSRRVRALKSPRQSRTPEARSRRRPATSGAYPGQPPWKFRHPSTLWMTRQVREYRLSCLPCSCPDHGRHACDS